MKKLVLIDGHAMAYRAYYAYPRLTDSKGHPTGALYGFMALLIKTVDDLKPDYLAVAFDLPTPTFRHETYIAYQAKRKTMDKDMSSQIEKLMDFLITSGIAVFSKHGFEADDVIATIARQSLRHTGHSTQDTVGEVIIVTGDRDILQLVDNKIKVCMPVKGISETKLLDEKGVKKYLGISPKLVVDYKALTGDSSDNYPGVPGIGPKTAVELLKKFGSFENIYKAIKGNNFKNLKQTIVNKLSEGKDSGLLSHKLAQIKLDVPIKFNLEKTALLDLKNNQRLLNNLKEYNFRSLIGRLKDEPPVEKKPKQGVLI